MYSESISVSVLVKQFLTTLFIDWDFFVTKTETCTVTSIPLYSTLRYTSWRADISPSFNLTSTSARRSSTDLWIRRVTECSFSATDLSLNCTVTSLRITLWWDSAAWERVQRRSHRRSVGLRGVPRLMSGSRRTTRSCDLGHDCYTWDRSEDLIDLRIW